MPWTWRQSTGQLLRNGRVVAQGYSGFGDGRNNPQMQGVQNVGPIPQGRWQIGQPRRSERTGPHVMDLQPIGHNAQNRTAFQIHGDNRQGNASRGCVILPRAIREQISQSQDWVLQVVE